MRKKKRAIVFGIFDGIHDGHRDLFSQALRVASGQAKEKVELVVIVGRDSASLKWKGKKPQYSQETRLSLVAKEKQVDRAVLGDEEQSTYDVIHKVSPDFICFGYDQEMLKKDLELWLEREELTIPCIVLRPYKETLLHTSLLRKKT